MRPAWQGALGFGHERPAGQLWTRLPSSSPPWGRVIPGSDPTHEAPSTAFHPSRLSLFSPGRGASWGHFSSCSPLGSQGPGFEQEQLGAGHGCDCDETFRTPSREPPPGPVTRTPWRIRQPFRLCSQTAAGNKLPPPSPTPAGSQNRITERGQGACSPTISTRPGGARRLPHRPLG